MAVSGEEGRWFALVGAFLPIVDEASPGLLGRPRSCEGESADASSWVEHSGVLSVLGR